MNAAIEIVPSVLDRIRKTLVGLKMPRALEVLDQTVRQLERGEASALEVIDTLFAEELTLRENRCVKMALRMAKLSTIKTLAGFDFSFQPSLDRNRILALAQLDFADRHEVIHFLGPPGTGKSHLATALGVEAVKAGRSVYFASLADIIGALTKAEREGQLRERIRLLCRTSLLIVDEIGYLPVIPGGGNLFFQLVNARYERGAMILTSNRGFAEWGEFLAPPWGARPLQGAVRIDAGPGRDYDLIVFAIDADAGAPCSLRKQVGALDHSVAAAIDVQSQSEPGRVVCIRQIGGTVSITSEEGIVVYQILTVAVDRVTEGIAPIDAVAHVLQRGELRLHEGGIIPVLLVAHQAFVPTILSHHSHRDTWHGTGQYFTHMPACEIALIAAQVENVVSLRVRAAGTIDCLSRLRLFAIVIVQMVGPGIYRFREIR